MSSYLDLGYNQFLEKVLLPAKTVSALDYDALYEDGSIISSKILANAITNEKIESLNWSKGQGGTLILGGSDNQSGILSLKDENAVEKIALNKDGMTVYDGKITLKNENAENIIDSKGLVSTTNFQFGTTILPSQVTRAAAGWGDVTGLSLSFTLARAANVLILASLTGKNSEVNSVGEQYVRFDINGTPTGVWDIYGTHTGGAREPVSVTIHYITELPAGNNTIKVQHRWGVMASAILLGSFGTDNAGSRLSYIVLGK